MYLVDRTYGVYALNPGIVFTMGFEIVLSKDCWHDRYRLSFMNRKPISSSEYCVRYRIYALDFNEYLYFRRKLRKPVRVVHRKRTLAEYYKRGDRNAEKRK